MVNYHTKVLISRIQFSGIPVTEIVPGTALTDMMIRINDRVHISIGKGYMSIVRRLPGDLFEFTATSQKTVIEKLKKVIAKN